LYFPDEWTFEMPESEGFRSRRFGASQTWGVWGGIEDKRLRRLSEAVERAIGDVLTVTVSQILDKCDYEEKALILILGPALPKVAGRFESLRPPKTKQIIWVCPTPIPDWIGWFEAQEHILPSYPSWKDASLSEGWEEEPVLVGRQFLLNPDVRPLVLQIFRLWGDAEVDIDPNNWNWSGPVDVLDGARIPKELRDAACMIELAYPIVGCEKAQELEDKVESKFPIFGADETVSWGGKVKMAQAARAQMDSSWGHHYWQVSWED